MKKQLALGLLGIVACSSLTALAHADWDRHHHHHWQPHEWRDDRWHHHHRGWW